MSVTAHKLTWRREQDGRGDLFLLDGVLDESSRESLKGLAAGLGAEVAFDLAGLRRINSLGVRFWVEFMKGLGGHAVSFRRCAPAFVEQLNAVLDFRGNAKVESIMAPYMCEKCGTVQYEELSVGADVQKGRDLAPPSRSCKKCDSAMIFDDIPERYLQFLAYL
jgi:hypothetical protein